MRFALGKALSLVACALLSASSPSFAETRQHLTWRKNRSVDASIDSWPLSRVLSRLATVSGWTVYVEPGLNTPISASFKNVAQGEALKLLLGKLNYALVPQAGAKPRLYVYQNTVGDATRQVAPEAKPKGWIANEILLVSGPDTKTDFAEIARQLGGKVVATSEDLNAARIQFDSPEAAEKARERLAGQDELDAQDNYSIDKPVITGSGTLAPSTMFPIDPSPVAPGEQVIVALVDTPIQPLEGKMKDFLLPTVHVSGDPGALGNDPTHGTAMTYNFWAGATAGDTPSDQLGKVRIQNVDIYGNKPTSTTFELAQGLYHAVQNAHVINLSLGSDAQPPVIDYLLEQAHHKGVVVVGAAGNAPTGLPVFPAANPNVIAVTAADRNGNIAPYANFADWVDTAGPSTIRFTYNKMNYYSSGTSTASAYTAGRIASQIAAGQTSAAAARSVLLNPIGTPVRRP